jgi:Trypsin
MRRILAVLAGAASIVLAGAVHARAATGIVTPDAVHAFVGVMAVYDTTGALASRCTGSLLTDRLFLTAGHCVVGPDHRTVRAARVWFEQDAGADYDPVTGAPGASGFPYRGGVPAHAFYSYGYPDSGIPETKDVAVVVLDAPVTTVYPGLTMHGALASAGTLDRYTRTHPGTTAQVTLSAYGFTEPGADPVSRVRDRARQQADTWVTGLDTAVTGAQNVRLSSSPGSGGSCFGDSGGPVLVRGTAVIAAVVSFGMHPNGCGGLELDYRIDQQAVLDWIAAVAWAAGEDKELVVL